MSLHLPSRATAVVRLLPAALQALSLHLQHPVEPFRGSLPIAATTSRALTSWEEFVITGLHKTIQQSLNRQSKKGAFHQA
ncbi:UNVERIFIED_CONTAM: hypothetical protein K2H54_023777 [Gekko kuhli]